MIARGHHEEAAVREQLVTAIEQRKVVTFTYRGHPRRVQPAAFGVGGRHHRETLHAYQVSGSSGSGDVPDWRNFNVAAIESLSVTDETFSAPPPGYNKPWIGEVVSALPGGGSSGGSGGGTSSGSGSSGGTSAPPSIGGIPLNADTAAKAADAAAKAAEAAGEALGKLGKWFRKR
jgi:hypothetical protein